MYKKNTRFIYAVEIQKLSKINDFKIKIDDFNLTNKKIERR